MIVSHVRFVVLLALCFAMMPSPFFPPADATDQETLLIKKTYRIAGEKYLAPFSYIDKNGEFTGFSIAFLQEIAKRHHVQFDYIPMDLYQAIHALKAGEIDAIMGLRPSSAFGDMFLFSDSYFTMADVVVIPKQGENGIGTLADLQNKTIAMREDPGLFSMLLNIRRVNFQLTLDSKDALSLLMMKRADAYLGNKWTTRYYLEQSGKGEEYTVKENLMEVPAEFSVAVNRQNDSLLSMINSELGHMEGSGEYQKLYIKWFGETEAQLNRLRMWIALLLVIFLASMLIMWLTYIWNKRLKQEVDKQTEALAKANQSLELQQRAIAQSHAFKTQIIENVYSGIVTLNECFLITSTNQRACEILDMQIGQNEAHPIPLMQRILHEYTAAEQGESHSTVFTREIEYEKSGKPRFVLYRVIPLNDPYDRLTGYLLTLADRTEERILQQKLATQEKMHALGQLVSGVAHEIRNPLTSMKTFIDLLPLKFDHPLFRQELLRHVPEALQRINRIVEDLLDYARPRYPRKKVFDVKELFDSMMIIMNPTLKKERIQLSVQIEPGMQLYCDPDQLKQVILNLILNAVDAMKDSPEKHLSIYTRTEGGTGCLFIADTGCGIQESNLTHIFEPFYTSKSHGVGLGLALSYQWIRENNGEIGVTTKEGKGATFRILLPSTDQKGAVI